MERSRPKTIFLAQYGSQLAGRFFVKEEKRGGGEGGDGEEGEEGRGVVKEK